MEDALVIAAKAPIQGKVKTRLLTFLTPQEATNLYESILLDILDRVSGIEGVERFVAFYPGEGRMYFEKNVSQKGFGIIEQKGDDLGERLKSVFSTLFDKGFSRIVIIGSDSPTLPLEYIKDAFDRLKQYQVVIGPCDDGGYYLIGLNSPLYDLFEGIRWGGSDVFKNTCSKARLSSYTLYILPGWYDIDVKDDLNRLSKDLEIQHHLSLKRTKRSIVALSDRLKQGG